MGGVHGRPKNLHGANDALLQAAENGELHTVAVLVGLGASVNGAVDQWGLTALMLAAEGGHTDIVSALVGTHNADVEATDVRGWAALMYAARNGHADTVNALREHGASGPETIPGESPFYRAPLPMTRLHSLETDAIRYEHDSSSGPETIASESPPAFIGAPLRVTSLRRQPATNAGESPPAFWGGIREFGSLRLSEADDFLFGDDSVPEEQLTCAICQHHVPRVRFHPCGHTVCRADARELLKRRQNCHVCRQPIIEMQPLYL